MSNLHMTVVIKEILQPETDTTGQRPYVRNLYLVEEYGGGQYPERAIMAVYDKEGNGSVWNKVLEKLGHFPAVEQPGVPGEPFELHFHLDAATGISSRTGQPYSIQKPISAWYFDKPEEHEVKPSASANEPCAYSIPGYNAQTTPQQMQAPRQQPLQYERTQQAQYAPAPQYNPYQPGAQFQQDNAPY